MMKQQQVQLTVAVDIMANCRGIVNLDDRCWLLPEHFSLRATDKEQNHIVTIWTPLSQKVVRSIVVEIAAGSVKRFHMSPELPLVQPFSVGS